MDKEMYWTHQTLEHDHDELVPFHFVLNFHCERVQLAIVGDRGGNAGTATRATINRPTGVGGVREAGIRVYGRLVRVFVEQLVLERAGGFVILVGV